MLMQVHLFKNPREAVVIPEEALVPRGERQTVLVVDAAQGYKVVERELRIGARRPGEVEVLAGLVPGDKVITDGTLKVRPGEAVAIRAVDDGARPLHDLLESQTQGAAPE
jgi:membrane fusion protein (multidrug efflux system)